MPVDISKQRKVIRYFYYVIIGMLVLTPLGLLASGTAFGEWSNKELLGRLRSAHISTTLPHGMSHGFNYGAALRDYTVPGTSLPIGYILSGVTAILIFVIIGKVLKSVYEKETK